MGPPAGRLERFTGVAAIVTLLLGVLVIGGRSAAGGPDGVDPVALPSAATGERVTASGRAPAPDAPDCQVGDVGVPCVTTELALPSPGFAPTFVVVEGMVYVGAGRGRVLAVDLTARAIRWDVSLATTLAAPLGVIDGVLVVRAGGDDGVVGLDARDGTRRWRTGSLGSERLRGATVLDATVLVAGPSQLAAVEAATGAVAWQRTYASLVVTDAGPLVRDGDTVTLVDPATGADRWSRTIRSGLRTAAADALSVAILADDGTTSVFARADGEARGATVTRGGTVALGSTGRDLYRLEHRAAGTTVATLPNNAGRGWRTELPLLPGPARDLVAVGDLVLVAGVHPDTGAQLIALERDAGVVRWRSSLAQPVTGVAADADGRVILAQVGGTGTVSIDPANGAIRWRLPGVASVVTTDPAVVLTRRDRATLRWIDPPR